MADWPTALDGALARYYGTGSGQAPRGAALRGVAEVRSPLSSARGLQARVRQMEKAYGGKDKAARAAGMHRDTWRKMAAGGKVKPETLRKLEKGHQRLTGAKFRKRSTGGKPVPRKMAVTAQVVVDPAGQRYINAVPRRTFNADVPRLNLGPVVKAWVRGDTPGSVALIAQQQVADAYQMDGIAFEGDADVELEER